METPLPTRLSVQAATLILYNTGSSDYMASTGSPVPCMHAPATCSQVVVITRRKLQDSGPKESRDVRDFDR